MIHSSARLRRRWGSVDARPVRDGHQSCSGGAGWSRGASGETDPCTDVTQGVGPMKTKSTAIRLLGGLLMAVALLPWLGGTAAQAAVTVHVDKKWIGTSPASAGVNFSDCNYDEIKQTHTGTGWHFVLTGTTGL